MRSHLFLRVLLLWCFVSLPLPGFCQELPPEDDLNHESELDLEVTIRKAWHWTKGAVNDGAEWTEKAAEDVWAAAAKPFRDVFRRRKKTPRTENRVNDQRKPQQTSRLAGVNIGNITFPLSEEGTPARGKIWGQAQT